MTGRVLISRLDFVKSENYLRCKVKNLDLSSFFPRPRRVNKTAKEWE